MKPNSSPALMRSPRNTIIRKQTFCAGIRLKADHSCAQVRNRIACVAETLDMKYKQHWVSFDSAVKQWRAIKASIIGDADTGNVTGK